MRKYTPFALAALVLIFVCTIAGFSGVVLHRSVKIGMDDSVGLTIDDAGAVDTDGAILSASTVTGTRLISTIATGTAPLTVASTTEVANLRAAKATALNTPRAINGVNFDGTAPITVPVNNTNDTATNASVFPVWVKTAAGNYSAYVTTDDLYFNPFTGMLTAAGLTASDGTNGTVYLKRVSNASPNVAQTVFATRVGINEVIHWLVGLRGDLAPGTEDFGFYNSAMSWVPTLLLQHATGNVGIGTTVFDYVAFPWTTAIHCSTVIKGKTSGISGDSPLALIDSNSQVSAIFANSGRLDLINYGGFGGTMVLQNQTSPAVNDEQTGHYAFSGRNSAGNMNTTGTIFNFIRDVTETSMNSEFHFGFMDHQDASGSDYKQPNRYIVLGYQGLNLIDYPLNTTGVITSGGIISTGPISSSTVTTFTGNDTTPSVASGNLFIVPGTWTTGNNVVDFDSGSIGQTLHIRGGDSDCVVVDGGELALTGNWIAATNATLVLTMYTLGNWTEESRSANG